MNSTSDVVETTKTLEEKISELVDNFTVVVEPAQKESFVRSIKKLVEITVSPDSFCPKCEDRLIFENNNLRCLNCGYKKQFSVTSTTTTKVENKNIPPEIETAIRRSQGASKGPLALEPLTPVTAVDNQQVMAATKNRAGNINWIN